MGPGAKHAVLPWMTLSPDPLMLVLGWFETRHSTLPMRPVQRGKGTECHSCSVGLATKAPESEDAATDRIFLCVPPVSDWSETPLPQPDDFQSLRALPLHLS